MDQEVVLHVTTMSSYKMMIK